MDYQNLERMKRKHRIALTEKVHLQQQNEIGDMNQNRQYLQSVQLSEGMKQLHDLFAMLQAESTIYPDYLPISFVSVEIQIAKCISECLHDVAEQNRDTHYIQSLLRDYKVVRFVEDSRQRYSVSLEQVHLILQDNYKDSSLCMLFNILLAGFMNVITKVITIS